MRGRLLRLAAAAAIVVAAPSACGERRSAAPGEEAEGVPIGHVTQGRLLDAGAEPGQWLTAGRDPQQSYFSPLTEIRVENVGELGFAWAHDLDFTGRVEATPIVVDGVMFTSRAKGVVHALDARTGAERWTFTPEIDESVLRRLCCGAANRGVAVWRGKVYVASIDGQLFSLDADTGEVVWKVDTITDRERGYSSTGAPCIAGDVVVIGNGGADFDARGYVTAYDTETGEEAWRFFTVPGDPSKGFEHPELEMAAKTWDPESLWAVGGGGTAWDGMAWDPKLDLLYVGTGNAIPYPRKLRSPSGGDNLFLASILAIDPDTGRLVWHYQTTPGESWDYTAVQKMILADLEIGGAMRQVIMQAPKNGFFYVLDRLTGELLSAEPYATVTWASHVELDTGRPVETEQARYDDAPKLIFPGTQGAHNWHPMAFNPETGLVYIPAVDVPEVYAMPGTPFEYRKGQKNAGAVHFHPFPGPFALGSELAKDWPSIDILGRGQPAPAFRSYLRAWDPVAGRVSWEVETTSPVRLPPNLFNGGVMTTAGGLVFQGRGDGRLYVHDAGTGAELHAVDVATSMIAAPMSYAIDGEQYVAIMAGVGAQPGLADWEYESKVRILAFKLGGGPVPRLRKIDRSRMENAPPPVQPVGSHADVERGAALFGQRCATCHAQAGGAPDLTKMGQAAHEAFLDVVLEGTLADHGMGDFRPVLTREEAEAIHAFLIDAAWRNHARLRPAQ